MKPIEGIKGSIVTAVVKKYISNHYNEQYLNYKLKKMTGEYTEKDYKENKHKRRLTSRGDPVPEDLYIDNTQFEENTSYFANPNFSTLRHASVITTPRRKISPNTLTLRLKSKLNTSKANQNSHILIGRMNHSVNLPFHETPRMNKSIRITRMRFETPNKVSEKFKQNELFR